MNTITTTLPLSLDNMKMLITTPDVGVVVEYGASILKGRTALIYLTNANVPVTTFDVTSVDAEQVFELVDAYVTHKSILRIDCLVAAVALLLLTSKKVRISEADAAALNYVSLIKSDQIAAYMANESRATNLAKLADLMDNVLIFAITCSAGFKQAVSDVSTIMPCVNDINHTGFTYVNLLERDIFVTNYYSAASVYPAKYFTQQFDEYMYGGRNLFSYVSNTFMLSAMEMFLTDPSQVASLLNALKETDSMFSET